ncbi:MAG: Mov34/MPN/PAD-1 family protein [Candidatus Riflebacteria bacterium]|nr:Mov34/MPN/PAD-1 family protein [Candidatus Riflebacteria bacterium]
MGSGNKDKKKRGEPQDRPPGSPSSTSGPQARSTRPGGDCPGDRPGEASASGERSPDVVIDENDDEDRFVQAKFPGPRGVEVGLRVAVDRGAYAELVVHAKETLDAEVGGVLVGQVCEDEEGVFLNVSAVIRGTGARQGTTSFTFTQDTWNAIHKELEEKHPDHQIVGWYHSHPGFGVEFSEMDLFIQRNFFKSPTQIAMLTDPLGGDVSICMETSKGIRHIDRFWVNGREHRCRTPAQRRDSGTEAEAQRRPVAEDALRDLEVRLRQVLVAVDDQRSALYRFLLTIFMVSCTAIVVVICYNVYKVYTSNLEPPRLVNFVPVPVQCGSNTVLLGVGITSWTVPPELNASYLQLEKEKRETEARAVAAEAARRLQESGGSSQSPGQTVQEPAKGR